METRQLGAYYRSWHRIQDILEGRNIPGFSRKRSKSPEDVDAKMGLLEVIRP